MRPGEQIQEEKKSKIIVLRVDKKTKKVDKKALEHGNWENQLLFCEKKKHVPVVVAQGHTCVPHPDVI